MPTGPVRLVVAGVAVLLVLAGCTGRSPDATPAAVAIPPSPTASSPTAIASPPAPDLPDVDSYVSIGDSFTAGPGLADLREGSGFCLRSDHNWPSLLASQLTTSQRTPTTFEDVSCSGATTADVLASHTIPGMVVPAQLDAVTPTTSLVTVGIGGNDGGLFSSLISACAQQGTAACASFVDDTEPGLLSTTGASIVRVLDAVRARAPRAKVLLVGYLSILPPSGTCNAVPLSSANAARGAVAEKALDDTLAGAARNADVDYVSMRDASRGHDACADEEAWTNGGTVADSLGIAFHPRPAGMQAVAQAVATALQD